MTPEKIRALCAFYIDYFERRRIPVRTTTLPPDATNRINSDTQVLECCHERCLHSIALLDDGHLEEALHWLYFVQAGLWSVGAFTFVDLEAMNKENNHPRP